MMRSRPPTIAIPKTAAQPRQRFNRAPIRPSAFVAADPAVLDLAVIGEIGFDLDANVLARQVAAFTGTEIALTINSGGGSVFESLHLYNALVESPARVVATITAWAASAASFIAMAADEIRIGAAAQIMVHEVSGLVIGTADDMRKESDVLDAITSSLVDIYAARTGMPRTKIAQMVRAETWMDGTTAVANGFADTIIPLKTAPVPAATDNSYRNMPASLRAALKAAITDHAGRSGRIESRADLEKQLREKLGIANGAARKIAAGGFGALAGDDNSEIEKLIARIGQAGAELNPRNF